MIVAYFPLFYRSLGIIFIRCSKLANERKKQGKEGRRSARKIERRKGREAGRESHPENAKYKNKVILKKLRPVDSAAGDAWTSRRRSAVMFVTIIGNNANRPPPFYSQPEHFQGVTAHSTSPHTNDIAIRKKQRPSNKTSGNPQTQSKKQFRLIK